MQISKLTGPSGFPVGYTVRLPFHLTASAPFVLSLSFDFAQDIRKKTDRGEPVEPQAQGERIKNKFG